MIDWQRKACLSVAAVGYDVVFTLLVEQLGVSFSFKFTCGSDWSAQLLARAIRDQLGSAMQRERSEAYDEGWRDAKAKKRAKTVSFFSRLP